MAKSLQFLSGGGEMGALMRAYNWESSPVGGVDLWPQSLLTTLGILLNSKFPMFLFWGPHHVCFYNDAYRPSLGNDGKHPSIFGIKGQEAWPEIWHIIKPLIDQVLIDSEATWSEDQLIPIYRNGKMEDVYWTFSYSPVKDESVLPAGVFVTCTDTTDKVVNLKKLAESNDQLSFAIEATELGTWDYNPVTNKFIGNNRLKEWFGLPHETEIELSLAMEVIVEKDRSRVSKAIQNALEYESAGLYDIEYTIINAFSKQERIVRAKGKAWFGDDKKPYRFNGTLQDITEKKKSQEAIEKMASYLKLATDSANVGTWSLSIQTEELEWSALHKKMWGYDEHRTDLTYEDWHKLILPQDKDKAFERIEHARVNLTDYDVEYRISRADDEAVRYIRSFGKYYYNDKGEAETLTGISVDITEQKETEEKIKEDRELFETTLQNVPSAIYHLDKTGKILYLNEIGAKQIGYATTEEALAEKDVFQLRIRAYETFTVLNEHGKPMPADQTSTALTFKTGKSSEVVSHLIHKKTGASLWLLSKASPLYDYNGGLIKVIATSTDITLRKTSEQTLRKSEEHFRTFANSIQNLAWIANDDGRIYWYNKQWYDYTGTTLEEMEGFGWQKVHHPDHVKNIIELTTELWKKDKPFELTFPLRRHDGEYRWFLTRAYPVTDANGYIERWIGTNTDITEQKSFNDELEIKVKERTHQLHIQNETFKVAEEIAKFGSYIWNLNTGLLEYSDNLFRLFGYEPQEFVPTFEKFQSFIHPDDLQQIIKNGEETMQTGKLVETPYRIINKTGKIKHFRSSGSFTGDDNNRILIGTVQDITKDLEAAEELRTKNLELENTNAELKSFSYIASHDLQEPLRKIQTFSKRIIETEVFSDKTQDYFNRIIAAGERMQNLIIALLDFSRTNKAELIFESCDLNTIVEESKSDLHLSIFEKHTIIEYQNLPTINGVHIQLCQLFTNLIDNAIKYSRPNIKPHIKITASIIKGKKIEHPSATQKMYYVINIADNGIGFENEYSIKIFELFQRLHGKNDYSGTGIGLAIVKKIVINHNGFIIAEGKPGMGSTFTIYIPTT